ncbi:4-hydroxyphenylpyruvate dioxygenase [Plantactinospora sp. WMMB334]|uniref:4-hydroxyphenylpyruvate dioxygenase n=1 Tax=Plantactinospora sp. WMMB334 TaxID=3404119 RepID=UPI003B931964
MEILGIDHVEMYVGDARQAAYYFSTAIGFEECGHGGPETGLDGQRSLLLRHGEVRVLLTSGLGPGHPAADYVHRHGDGIAVVALAVDDVVAAYTELVARGAAALTPPVSYAEGEAVVRTALVGGFGDVVHRLVERRGDGAEFLPGAIRTSPAHAAREGAGDGAGAGKLFRRIDHLAVCVPSGQLAETVRRYEDVFGFHKIFAEYVEVAGQGMNSEVVQSPSGQVTLVLIEPDPTRRPGQVSDFLRWHDGSGVQHLGLLTDDIVRSVTDLSARGVGFGRTPVGYYERLEERVGPIGDPVERLRDLGILVDRDHGGQLLQIFTESMHVRRTLFLELIERRGASTFGSGNVRALYEAKERELAALAASGATPERSGVPG